MGKQVVSARFKPNTIKSLRTLIESLQECEKKISTNEDTEIILACDVSTASYSIIICRLATVDDHYPNKRFEIVSKEALDLYGELDELNTNNEWVRIFPE